MQAATPSAAERAVDAAMLAVFWAAFIALAAGLVVWAAGSHGPQGNLLLTGGLLGLIGIPILRLAATLVAAIRCRDRITIWATLAVLTILIALTLRDASRH